MHPHRCGARDSEHCKHRGFTNGLGPYKLLAPPSFRRVRYGRARIRKAAASNGVVMKKIIAVGLSSIVSVSAIAADAPKSTTKQSTTVLPIEDFTRFDDVGGFELSPSGEYVAYLTGKYGRSEVYVINLKEKKAVGGIRCPENK